MLFEEERFLFPAPPPIYVVAFPFKVTAILFPHGAYGRELGPKFSFPDKCLKRPERANY
jgi:hypothetical protein